jgi:hypothetical protein
MAATGLLRLRCNPDSFGRILKCDSSGRSSGCDDLESIALDFGWKSWSEGLERGSCEC